MSTTANRQVSSTGFDGRRLLWSIVFNAVVPLLIYRFMKNHYAASDVVALSIAALFPAINCIASIVRNRRLNIIGVLALAGIVLSIIASLLTNDPRVLLIRESFVTGPLGIACFVSLLMPRPLMFYIGKQFTAASNPAEAARFDELWQYPHVRFVHRMITAVWGVAFVGEFLIRTTLAYTLPAATVLAISPFLFGGITLLTVLWTFAYVRHAKQRGAEIRRREQEMEVA